MASIEFLFILSCVRVVHGSQLPSVSELAKDKATILKPGGSTGCADESEFFFVVVPGKSNSIVVDFMGGGACWSGEESSCNLFNKIPQQFGLAQGLPRSSFCSVGALLGFQFAVCGDHAFGTNLKASEWTYVFVPYCTQDIHVGSRITTFQLPSGDFTARFNGAENVAAVREWIYGNFESPETYLLIGCSAGAGPVLALEAVHAKRQYASSGTRVVAIGDAPPLVLQEKFVSDALSAWGDWPCLIDHAAQTNSSLHINAEVFHFILENILSIHPDIQLAYYISIEDTVLPSFWRQMGNLNSMDIWRRHFLSFTESLGRLSNFHAFVGSRAGHCVTSFDSAGDVNGLSQWIEDIIFGRSPGIRRCSMQECSLSSSVGCDGTPGSGEVEDRCGVCQGDGSSCAQSLPPYVCARETATSTEFVTSTEVASLIETVSSTTAHLERDDELPGEVGTAQLSKRAYWTLLFAPLTALLT